MYPGSSLGISVATAGDVNGDSYADIIIGEYWYDTDFADGGRAVVAYGSASGLSDGWNWTAHSDQRQGQLGYSVATAGDVNGDGYSDIIVGAPYFNFGSEDEGKAFVWYGSEDGPNHGMTGTMDNADWTAQGDQVQADGLDPDPAIPERNEELKQAGDGFSQALVVIGPGGVLAPPSTCWTVSLRASR